MSKRVIIEEPIGVMDGVNTDFRTRRDYAPGSVRAMLPLWESPSFITELGGNRVRLAEAPRKGDTLLIWYRAI